MDDWETWPYGWLVPFLLLALRGRGSAGAGQMEGLAVSGREEDKYMLSRRRYVITEMRESSLPGVRW